MGGLVERFEELVEEAEVLEWFEGFDERTQRFENLSTGM
jgi:hypothetical protein